MCQSCYKEYGSPRVITDAVRRSVHLISSVYDYSMVGGHCHVVLDDWNLNDEDIDNCLAYINIQPTVFIVYGVDLRDQTKAELECMKLMQSMSIDERATALALYDRFIEEDKS